MHGNNNKLEQFFAGLVREIRLIKSMTDFKLYNKLSGWNLLSYINWHLSLVYVDNGQLIVLFTNASKFELINFQSFALASFPKLVTVFVIYFILNILVYYTYTTIHSYQLLQCLALSWSSMKFKVYL